MTDGRWPMPMPMPMPMTDADADAERLFTVGGYISTFTLELSAISLMHALYWSLANLLK
jgi:hypothetical protein